MNPILMAGDGSLFMIIYVVAIVAVFYFLMIRPQRKEQKKTAAMQAGLAIGDVICTTGGFYGVVIDLSDDTVIVEFGNNKNCRIPMKREAIAAVEHVNEAE